MFAPLKVTVILVNFNGWRDTVNCLESLLQSTYTKFDVLVIDNDSTDNSTENILRWAQGKLSVDYPASNLSGVCTNIIQKPIPILVLAESEIYSTSKSKLTLIKSSTNYGFAGGNNLGIKRILSFETNGYVWLLNNDTIIPASTLEKLVTKAYGSPKSIWGNKLMFLYKPTMIQAVAGRYNKWLGITTHIGENELDRGQYDTLQFSFDYIVGASIFLPIEVFRKVGLLDERYFIYFEELDLAQKAKKAGYKFQICTDAIVFHKEGASIQSSSKTKLGKTELSDFYYIRNKILFTSKYYKLFLPFIYLSLIISIMNRLKRKQPKRALQILKIILSPKNHFRKS